MNKSEKLKSERKIKFKCFLLANILTLFFAMVFFLPTGGPVALAADNSFDFSLAESRRVSQENTYSEPFSKLIEFLNAKKNELAKYDGDFLSAKTFSSGADSADEINPAASSFASAVFESIKNFVVDSPKQYLGTVFESVKNFVFPGPNQNNFEYKSPNNKENAKEIEKLKQQYEVAIDETNVISQKFSLLQSEIEKIKKSGVVIRQPIIEQKVVERTIERIVDSLPRSAGAGSSLSQSDLDSKISDIRTELSNLNTNLTNQINNLSASTNRQTAATYQTISLTNKIDSLSGTRLTNITVNGVSGLTDSDIPDGITASNYLLLTGGTIAGSFDVSGQTNLTNATATNLTATNAWFTGNVGIGTTSPYAKLSVVGPVAAEYFHATSTAATSTFSGRLAVGFAPTLAHNFGSWSVGASGANPLGASFIINPSSAAADSNLLSLSVNGSAKFLVDAEGDVFANAVTVVGGTTLSTTTASTFAVENNATLGDATTTDITYFNSRIADSLFPTADNYLDLGDSANWLRWRTGYFGTSVGIGGTATSTGTQLTTSGTYLIDTNNTLSINTTNNKAVSFGTGNVSIPYASSTALTVSGSAYIGSLNGPLQANNGLVSATTSIGTVYGGTGINSSALTGIAQIVSGTWSASSTLSAAFGGTGWNAIQSGYVPFGNGAAALATSTSFYWDNSNSRLGVGTSTPYAKLSVWGGGIGTGQAFEVTNNASTSLMTILDNGNVGIGTAAPGGLLSVAAPIAKVTVDTSYPVFFTTNDASNPFSLRFGITGAAAIGNRNVNLQTTDINLVDGGNIVLQPVTGNVGIGDNTPLAMLTVGNGDLFRVISTGEVRTIAGGVGAPSYSFTGDTNTGIYSGGADILKLVTGGSDMVTIDASGNIGIGTTSPYAKLSVVGETVSTYFTATSTTATSTFAGGMNVAGSSGLTVLQNGNVGIGTTMPSNSLSLVGGTGLMTSNNDTGAGVSSFFLNSVGNYGTAFSHNREPNTGAFLNIASSPNQKNAVSLGIGNTVQNSLFSVGNFPSGNYSAKLLIDYDGNIGIGGSMTTTVTGANMAILSDGKVGIGTSTPDSKLTVFANADDSAIEFSSASGSTYKWTMGMDYSDAGKFKIASSTALGSIDRFTIDGNGYVGIGTSTPARRLDVADSGTNIPQLRLSRESNIYTDFSVAQTTGDLSLALYGTNADDISLLMPDGSTGANLWVCEGAACPNGISFTGGGNLFVEGVIKYATSTTPKTRRSIILTAAGAIVPATSGAAKTQVDGTNHSYYVLDFDASSDEAAYWQWTMPDSYDDGAIDITYYWEAGATSGDSIFCFQAKGLSANSSEDIDSALSSAVCETDTAQANANDLASITETNATSNFTAGEYVTFKIFRDADVGGDTMTGDTRLVKVKIEYGVATESD